MRGYRPDFGKKFGWSLRSKVMGTSDHFRYSEVAGETAMTSWAEFLFHLRLIAVRSTVDVIDLLMNFEEITLWLFGHLLLIGLSGHLEHHIYETTESVTVPGFVLSLGVENANLI
jgi:hypothetical protein